MATARAEAVQLLQHYFRLAFENAGLNWQGDNNAEVDYIVNRIIQAVREEYVHDLEQRVSSLEETINRIRKA